MTKYKPFDVDELDEIIVFNGQGDLIEFYREGKYIFLVKPKEKDKRYYRFDLQKNIFERVNFYKTVDDKITQVDVKNLTSWFKDCKLVTKDLHFGRLVIFAKYNRAFDRFSSPVRFIEQLGSSIISNIEKWEALGIKVTEIEEFFSDHLVGNNYRSGRYDDRKNIYLGTLPRNWTTFFSGYLSYAPGDFSKNTFNHILETYDEIDNSILRNLHSNYNNGEEKVEAELIRICQDPEFLDALNYTSDRYRGRGVQKNVLDSDSGSFYIKMNLIHLIQEFNLDIESVLRYLKKQRNRENNDISYMIDSRHYRDYLVCERDLKDGSFSKMNKYPNNFRTTFHNVQSEYSAKKAVIDRKKFKVHCSKYKDLEKEGKEFSIIVPNDPSQIEIEADVLQHCVRTYIPRVCEGQTLICFLRYTKRPNDPYVTLEVKNGILTQAYGKNDSKPNTKALDFLKKWLSEKDLQAGCWRSHLYI